MTEQRAPYLRVLANQNEPSVLGTSARLSLGQITISVDNPDFRHGHEQGVRQYEQWHRDDRFIDAAMLLFLIRNGWGSQRYSDMWQTGYIVGWLGALFPHAHSLGGT